MINSVHRILAGNLKTTIPLSFEEFIAISEQYKLTHELGLAIFSDKDVTIFFDAYSNVTFIVKSNKFITKKDFANFSLKLMGAREPLSFKKFFIEEISINKFPLLLILLLLTPFLLLQDDKEFIKEINAVLISATSILIGIFLVFITFFYLGKQNDLRYFKEGRFHEHFKNDKYIILFAFITILISTSAIAISYYTYNPKVPIGEWPLRIILGVFSFIFNSPYQKPISGFITVLGFMGFWINFKAVTGYYFDRIKNDIYKEAIERIHEEYFNRNKDSQ